jgi:hypothetical protein
MPPNGRQAKFLRQEFAEPSIEAAEPYAAAPDRVLQCKSHINRIGANP